MRMQFPLNRCWVQDFRISEFGHFRNKFAATPVVICAEAFLPKRAVGAPCLGGPRRAATAPQWGGLRPNAWPFGCSPPSSARLTVACSARPLPSKKRCCGSECEACTCAESSGTSDAERFIGNGNRSLFSSLNRTGCGLSRGEFPVSRS